MRRPFTIRDFLAALGSDPELLSEYVRDPVATMTAAGLSPDEQQLLRSGDEGLINQALAAINESSSTG